MPAEFGGVIIFFLLFYFFLENPGSINAGHRQCLLTWLCILPCLSSDAVSAHLSQSYPSFLRSQPVSPRLLFGRGMLWGAWAFWHAGLPWRARLSHSACILQQQILGSLCQCQPQQGGQDKFFLPLAAKQWCGLVVFTCWEVKPVPERGFEIHPLTEMFWL